MLFADRFLDGLRDGVITTTVRRWKRPKVKVGGRYRIRAGLALEVDSVAGITGHDPAKTRA